MATLRCRLGLHRWTRRRTTDRTLAEPELSPGWRTVCRDCGAERGSGTRMSVGLFGAFVTVGLVLLWLVPFLGAVVLVGAVLGGMWSTGPAVIDYVARRLGGG